ncbi:hypothetical protein AGMMS49983_00670 [Clostridia bacterium]|nr:hypothetical protein AGMMS49983_00670 [Clostridia bacterium]
MDATITIPVKDLFVGLLILAIIVLIVFAIVAVYHLIITLKKAEKVLGDFEVVSAVASKRTKQLDDAIEKSSKKIKAGGSVGSTLTSAIPIIISAITAIAKYATNKKSDTDKAK